MKDWTRKASLHAQRREECILFQRDRERAKASAWHDPFPFPQLSVFICYLWYEEWARRWKENKKA
jgi:hypothetical protein